MGTVNFTFKNFYFLRATWIRICMDTHSFSKLDPDPHSQKVNADPKHWP
jgi:hypothetical protein